MACNCRQSGHALLQQVVVVAPCLLICNTVLAAPVHILCDTRAHRVPVLELNERFFDLKNNILCIYCLDVGECVNNTSYISSTFLNNLHSTFFQLKTAKVDAQFFRSTQYTTAFRRFKTKNAGQLNLGSKIRLNYSLFHWFCITSNYNLTIQLFNS